ncbi:MAG: ABC transporter transmembrane domain-containing protein, partial [Clostridia bacterium]
MLEAIFELLVPLIMADLIDNGINNANATLGFILGRGGIMLALGVVGFGCSLLCQYIASKCSQGYGTDLRNGLYEHINKLSFDNLDKLGASALITR